jgi:hypothetical protein
MKKQIIIVILSVAIMASSLFLIVAYKPANSEAKSSSETVSTSEQRLQSQINELSIKLSAANTILSQLQSQPKSTGTQTASSTGKIDAVAADTKTLAALVDSLQTQVSALKAADEKDDLNNLTAVVGSLQTQVKDLQNKLKGAETTIGSTPVTVNGLNIIFITDEIKIGITDSTSPNAAQFAIKVINTTNSALNSVDITGTITTSQNFSESFASGYPQLIDGAGLCSYVYFIKQSNIMHFEAFGNAKTSLSIPVGSSITLRPKISLLAMADGQLPPATINIALDTITYDKVTAK